MLKQTKFVLLIGGVAAMLNAAAARKRRRLIAFIRISLPSLPSLILFEVEIGQIHVAAGQDVDGENIPPLAQADLEELRSQVPVVNCRTSERSKWGEELRRSIVP